MCDIWTRYSFWTSSFDRIHGPIKIIKLYEKEKIFSQKKYDIKKSIPECLFSLNKETWRTTAMPGMNASKKAVGALFMATNSRHGGMNVIDVGALTAVALVTFVVVMQSALRPVNIAFS